MSLSDRQSHILRTVVEEYVNAGRPVGSAAALERSGLDVSSATVRNDLAVLEDQGYVLQLHTSGGRIPTTHGYRYYVECLLPRTSLSEQDQVTIRHQFHQAQMELDEWLKLAAAVMAHRAHNVALVTTPRMERSRFRHVELIEAQPHGVLVVVVMEEGTVLQETIPLPVTLSQAMLRGYADLLNTVFSRSHRYGRSHVATQDLPPELAPYAEAVTRLLTRAQERRVSVYHEGLGEMLSRPEFANGRQTLGTAERLRRVVDFLQQGFAVEDLLSAMAIESGVQVVIGGEPPLDELRDYSIVVGRYGGGGEGGGFLGLMGPTRMKYDHAISLVSYMSELMTDLILGR